MKKLTFLFVAILLLLTLVPAVFANPPDPPFPYLTAGGGNPKSAMIVGKVKIQNDSKYLYVKYDTAGYGWCLTETHLHVFLNGTTFTDVPHKNGNPIPGHFEYSMEYDCAPIGEMHKIPNVWAPGTVLYIAAHAVVCKCDCGDGAKCTPPTCECSDECETAWGGDYFDYFGKLKEFPGRNWAIFFEYTIK